MDIKPVKLSPDADSVVGSCMKMCPAKEYAFREKHKLLHSLEIINDKHICVKEFRRSAAGEVICNKQDIRPAKILLQTIDYLFDNVLTRENVPFVNIYDFIFDRLRSVRQDAVIQCLHDIQPHACIEILQKCVRFYLYAAFRKTLAPHLALDAHINSSHARTCLDTLFELYNYVEYQFPDNEGLNSCISCLACRVLLTPESQVPLLTTLWTVPRRLRTAPPLKVAVEMCVALDARNFVRFMKNLEQLCVGRWVAPLCCLATRLSRVRDDVIRTLCVSHNSKLGAFPAAKHRTWLLVRNEADVVAYCRDRGLEVTQTREVRFKRDARVDCENNIGGCAILGYLGYLFKGNEARLLKRCAAV